MSSVSPCANELAPSPVFASPLPSLAAAEDREKGSLPLDVGKIFLAHAEEVKRFARRRVGVQEADDVVQDVYLHILQRTSRDPVEQPRAYLFRVAANLTVDRARKAKTRLAYFATAVQEVDGSISPDQSLVRALKLRRLESALAELPNANRTAFLLSRLEGLTLAEIGERLGLSIRTIERYVDKASNHLRERLE